MKAIYTLILVLLAGTAYGQSNLPVCRGWPSKWDLCNGKYKFAPDCYEYVGAFKDGKKHGQGKCTFKNGETYVGEYIEGKMYGHGTYTFADGDIYIGEFKDNTITQNFELKNQKKIYAENPIIKKILTGEVRFNCKFLCIPSMVHNAYNLKRLFTIF